MMTPCHLKLMIIHYQVNTMISGNFILVVIYSLNEDGIVYFSRIGTHSQLFKNI